MTYTRRELGKLMLTAAVLPRTALPVPQRPRPDSKFAGVQIGMNVPYNFGSRTLGGDETLAKTLQLGISAVELRSQPVELLMGAPLEVLEPGRGKEAQAAAAAQLRAWRLKTRLSNATAFRRKWDEAGVRIEIVKYDGIYDFTDAEMDYAFKLAKALGARAISCEIDVEKSKRVGQFADRHKLMVGYHGHTKVSPPMWETAFGYAKYNGANVDIGHFVAGDFGSPVPFITAHHDRITHVHIKDRKVNDGDNVPFGEGDTPIKEVLQLIRDSKWPIQATIEFEYNVPPGSDKMAEMAKCVQYCKDALLS